MSNAHSSQLTDAYGIPLVAEPAPANIRGHTLLPATLNRYDALAKMLGPFPERPALSLDAGYDYRPVHADLDTRGITARITKRGEQTPIQTDGRWVVQRTHSWMNNFGKLGRCTERRRVCIDFCLAPLSLAQPPTKPAHPVTYWRDALSARTDVSKSAKLAEALPYWLDHVVKPRRRLRTFDKYEEQVRLHLVPLLGRVSKVDLEL